MTDQDTTSEQFGYGPGELDALLEKACNLFWDYIDPNEHTKKAVFDKICEISTSPRDVFVITSMIKDLENDACSEDDDTEDRIAALEEKVTLLMNVNFCQECRGEMEAREEDEVQG